MNIYNRNEIVLRAKALLDYEYLYGYKFRNNPVKVSLIDVLRRQHSSVYDSIYYNKAVTFVGKNAIDCSGLVCYALGIADIGSWQIHDLPKTNKQFQYVEYSAIEAGDIVWKEGHCGIYIGDGKVIEARGINYGVVVTDYEGRGWRKNISVKEVPVYDYEKIGWSVDGIGWWYPWGHNRGEFFKNEVVSIGGRCFAFDSEGYLTANPRLKTDNSGVVIGVESGAKV